VGEINTKITGGEKTLYKKKKKKFNA